MRGAETMRKGKANSERVVERAKARKEEDNFTTARQMVAKFAGDGTTPGSDAATTVGGCTCANILRTLATTVAARRTPLGEPQRAAASQLDLSLIHI